MVPAQNQKYVHVAAAEALVDNASLATTAIDTKDWDYCTILFRLGTTDIAMTALAVQHSDDNGSSDAYANVTGLVYGTSNGINGAASTLPSATSDGGIYVFQIDCRQTKRYLDLLATFGDGTAGGFAYAIAILSRGAITPDTAAEAGAANILRI